MTEQHPSTPSDDSSQKTDTPFHDKPLKKSDVGDEQPSQRPPASETVTSEQKQPPRKKKPVKLIITIIIILLLGLIAFGLWKSYQPKTVSVQGRVEADTIHVSTKVPSRIEQIYVHDGQRIQEGEPLIKLTSPEIEAKKQQALAALQSALALQSTAERGSQQENIETLYANWQGMKAQAELANKTHQRGETLYREGVISRQRRDQMHAAKISASQMAEAAYQQYARAKRGSTPQQKSSADAQVEIARAAVAEANALEAETMLHSPVDGTISKVYGKASELVVIGVPVVSILQDEYWVSLNIREDQYASIYKEKTLQGFIPALNQSAQFAIKNIEAEGEFATIKTTRQTGGYDIRSFRLYLEPTKPIPDLKVGMSVIFQIQEK